MLPIASKLTPDEFLAWEREQTTRHIFVGGDIFSMSGGSLRHNRLGAQVVGSLVRGAADGECGVYSSDQKIGLPNDEFVYADAVMLCPPIVLRPGTTDVVTNPIVVVEVLSKSTEAYDRGDKQRGYLALPSLRHFVLVAQREVRVELYTRQDDGTFRFEVLGQGGTMMLQHPAMSVAVDDLYTGVLALPGD